MFTSCLYKSKKAVEWRAMLMRTTVYSAREKRE